MSVRHDESVDRWGLLANGSSGCWTVDVDESLAGGEWTLAVEGPQVSLLFQLQDLSVLQGALRFLQTGRACPAPGTREHSARDEVLVLGRFGTAPVSLLRDNEDFPRYFLLVGPEARSALRLRLAGDDIEQFSEALRQVVQDLPEGNQ